LLFILGHNTHLYVCHLTCMCLLQSIWTGKMLYCIKTRQWRVGWSGEGPQTMGSDYLGSSPPDMWEYWWVIISCQTHDGGLTGQTLDRHGWHVAPLHQPVLTGHHPGHPWSLISHLIICLGPHQLVIVCSSPCLQMLCRSRDLHRVCFIVISGFIIVYQMDWPVTDGFKVWSCSWHSSFMIKHIFMFYLSSIWKWWRLFDTPALETLQRKLQHSFTGELNSSC